MLGSMSARRRAIRRASRRAARAILILLGIALLAATAHVLTLLPAIPD